MITRASLIKTIRLVRFVATVLFGRSLCYPEAENESEIHLSLLGDVWNVAEQFHLGSSSQLLTSRVEMEFLGRYCLRIDLCANP
jgi:hypothetical protein